MRKILLSIILFTTPIATFAQQGFYQSQNLTVTKNSIELTNPWAGGLNVPQFSPIDLNFDGIADLVIFDKNGDQLNCYINNGTPNQIDYHFSPEYNSSFPEINDWMLLRDYNCDAKADLFTSSNGGIKVYKNTSINGILSFEYIETILTDRGSGPTNLYVSSVDLPHIGDIDYDGDLDILTFTIIGSHVEWHKNYSMETFNTCDSLIYQLEDDCWGDFSENFSDNSVTLNDCESRGRRSSSKHSGSTVTAIDLNGDQHHELLLGDVTFNNLVMLENSADAENALMINQDTSFPNYSTPVDIPKFPAAYFMDFNNDDKNDLIVSPNGNNVSHNYQNIWFYKNESTDEAITLNFIQNNTLLDQMIEVGSGANPVLFDYNGDGLQDLLVGNYGYYIESGNYNSQLALYQNIGAANDPEFMWITDDYANLGTLNFENNISPTFGDLDNDGDLDMLVGDADGKLHLLNNISIGGESNFFINTVNYFDIDVGSFASPFLVDLDRDDDLDLLIGTRHGNILFYENQGNSESANFILTSEQLGAIYLTDSIYNTAYTTPMVVDGTDGYELFVGTEKGRVHHYKNIEDNVLGSYIEVSDSTLLYSKGTRTAPFVYDINNDGWLDMLLGIYTGGVHLLWGCDYNNIQVEDIEKHDDLFYPNPSNGLIHVRSEKEFITIQVYTMNGQICYQNKGEKTINLNHLPPGIYFAKTTSIDGSTAIQKLSIF